ncbi:FAD-binding oxidoreductase [Nocardia sp. CA-128927]|uniref:FAD-binding oxidoreductase n=1 Tax=Nocardia sp. CA-128927 TaxID=3239975 RepID=UPI003D9639DB
MTHDASTTLPPGAVQTLRSQVTGTVSLPSDPTYSHEIAAFNLRSVHRPALVVAAATPGDVQAAVAFAATHRLPVGVLSTGHQPFPTTTSHGCLLISTRAMHSVQIDPATATARVEAGALWGDVVGPAQSSGLAPLNGSSAGVGVIGYTLGGGLSPVLGRLYGWASEHVRAIDVVTADGRLRHVTEQSDPDLLWALRGGRSNFGVVTALEIALFPVSTFYGGAIFYPAEQAEAVLRAYHDVAAQAPDALSVSVALLNFPPLPDLPELLRGKFVVHVRVAFIGAPAAAEELLSPLRRIGEPLADTIAPRPYDTYAELHQDPTDPAPYEDQSTLLSELTPDTITALLARVGPAAANPVTVVEIRHLGGALGKDSGLPSTAGARLAAFTVWAATVGPPDVIETGSQTLRALMTDLSPWSTSLLYPNFTHREALAENLFSPLVLADLQRVKQRYDPENLFRANNHNIFPLPGTDAL